MVVTEVGQDRAGELDELDESIETRMNLMTWLLEAEDVNSPLQYTLQGTMLRTNRY
jgi:hypothetical protein